MRLSYASQQHHHITPRNAAKKRFKDPAARLEKRFFGRQKLNVLSKPIPTNPAKIMQSSSDIGFTHARRRTASMEGTSRIESPNRRFEAVRLSSEGSENRNSKVLEALDTSERRQCVLVWIPCVDRVVSAVTSSSHGPNLVSTRPRRIDEDQATAAERHPY